MLFKKYVVLSLLKLVVNITMVLFAGGACAAVQTIAVLGVDNDPRYAARQIDRAYPDHPTGRAVDAARVAVEESEPEMAAVGHSLIVKPFLAANALDLARVMMQIRSAKIQYVLLDLPVEALRHVVSETSAGPGAPILFNIGASADDLRGLACSALVLHTYPSASMLSDALAQFLASKSWTQLLVLHGQKPQDKLQLDALVRSAKRYGLKLSKALAFKISGDPRERDLGNTRLLTNDKNHDVVAVLDTEGEFARTLQYNTQWPRPVVGSVGLVPMAWHPRWERNGAPQLNRRFGRLAHRPMTSQDWAAWLAVKAVVAVLSERPQSRLAEQLQLLRSGKIFIDGFKGPALSFRAWDGQLRQPILLGHADGVAASAPFEGVLHPSEVLDTLGFDEKETACRARP